MLGPLVRELDPGRMQNPSVLFLPFAAFPRLVQPSTTMPRKMKNKAAVPADEPPTKRTKLFDEDAVSDDDAVNLTINEDFARRFEHNKKREEKQRRTHLCLVACIARR